MKNQSMTITGLLIMAILFIGQQAGVVFTEGDLSTTLKTIIGLGQVVGFIVAYIGRLRKGDIKWFGGRI